VLLRERVGRVRDGLVSTPEPPWMAVAGPRASCPASCSIDYGWVPQSM
jgi:hypothetical protein